MPSRHNNIGKESFSCYLDFICMYNHPFLFPLFLSLPPPRYIISPALCISDFPAFPSAPPALMLGEAPPPYSPLGSPESGSAPVISCRVCQSLISVEGKIHQHVVKCGVCNEATVSQQARSVRIPVSRHA